MQSSRIRSALLGAAACGLGVCGCALFEVGRGMVGVWPYEARHQQNPLPPIQPSREALQIDVVFIERPVGDPLIGNALWKDLEELGAVVAPEEREAIKRLGLRVGTVGATPCAMLERLLENTIDPLDAGKSKKGGAMQLRTFCVSPNEEPQIETGSVAECTIEVPTLSESKKKPYNNFTGVLRLATHRMNDGWARLDFTPEIHYGEKRLRAVSASSDGKNAWQPRVSQEVDPLLAQRFSVTLHVGEMAVITGNSDRPTSFGFCGFVQNDPTRGAMQRLMIVRLSNMARIDPIYARANPSDRSNGLAAPSASDASNFAEKRLPGGK
jgi:hypothetical protein